MGAEDMAFDLEEAGETSRRLAAAEDRYQAAEHDLEILCDVLQSYGFAAEIERLIPQHQIDEETAEHLTRILDL